MYSACRVCSHQLHVEQMNFAPGGMDVSSACHNTRLHGGITVSCASSLYFLHHLADGAPGFWDTQWQQLVCLSVWILFLATCFRYV